MMIRASLLVSIALAVLSTEAAAQLSPHARYREFVLGSDLATVAKLTRADPAAAKVVHRRPATITTLEWRPRYSGETTDAADVMTFKFYNDRLFTIVVDYDQRRTEGMTTADMIDAISAAYGVFQVPSNPVGAREGRYGFPDTLLATWGDPAHSISLMRVTYPHIFRLVVTANDLARLADVAAAAATRLDAEEAPQRELERQKKQQSDSQDAREKARSENKALFKP